LDFLIGMNTDYEGSWCIEDFDQIKWKHRDECITKKDNFFIMN
jgi:hypothetical protein